MTCDQTRSCFDASRTRHVKHGRHSSLQMQGRECSNGNGLLFTLHAHLFPTHLQQPPHEDKRKPYASPAPFVEAAGRGREEVASARIIIINRRTSRFQRPHLSLIVLDSFPYSLYFCPSTFFIAYLCINNFSFPPSSGYGPETIDRMHQ